MARDRGEEDSTRPGLCEGPAPSWQPALVPLGGHRPEARLRVLLVDEKEERFRHVREMLASASDTAFALAWASGVEAGLRRLAGEAFDVCLVSYRLPGRDGLAFVRLAQARGFEVPIIMIGGGADGRIDLESLETGVADYFDEAELDPSERAVARLERVLRFAVARERRLDRLDRLAQFDPLTGLANRALYHDRLERALARARRHGGHLAVMILDLNGFKSVNDRLGHGAGDQLLRVVADRLAGRLRQTDTVARLGGDEFAVCAEHLATPEDAPLVAQKLLKALSPPVDLGGATATVTGSLGVALFPTDAADAATLLRLADEAMYRAKDEGGNRCRFHDPQLDGRMQQGVLIEADLGRALEAGDLALHFQPQVTLAPGELGLAASVHWRHPELGLASGEQVRAMAEATSLVEPLTDWLIRAACRHARAWQDAGFERFHVAVPMLSRRQLAWSGLAERVRDLLGKAGLAPERLELEVSEGLAAQDLEIGGGTLAALKGQGVRLALDAFGGGRAPLALLTDVPLDTVKLARSLLRGTPEHPRRTALVGSMVRLARRLGLRVVAEGVENQGQLHMLRREGCDAVQALMSCPPLPAAACLDWLREATARS